MKISKSPVKLYASAKAVICQFLYLPGEDRVKKIVERTRYLSENEVNDCLADLRKDFGARHREIDRIFREHFLKACIQYDRNVSGFSVEKTILLGAFFTKEYSIQAAALFNPSIVEHPDQGGVAPGELRFLMSLRATGEGHISSVIFKTGTVDQNLNIQLDQDPRYFTRLKRNDNTIYKKEFLEKRTDFLPGFKKELLEILPPAFTATQALTLIKEKFLSDLSAAFSIKEVSEILDSNYELQAIPGNEISEQVIFPDAKSETMGIEDLRLVRFTDEAESCYYGTYTAYNGREIKTRLIETRDFTFFKMSSLAGAAVSDKGMALFPEKINGKYAMISRQGGEQINIMFSGDLYYWESFTLLMEPHYPWELVQAGNCGSPVKTEKGWLLLTHGVGAMRTYVISAILLDLADPTKIIGRLEKPLLTADESEREGYVPNVVYTCGVLRHGDFLVVPYAVSDSATGFATIVLKELLDELKKQ